MSHFQSGNSEAKLEIHPNRLGVGFNSRFPNFGNMASEYKSYCNDHLSATERLSLLIRSGENQRTILDVLKEGVDINAYDSNGLTPLMVAALFDRHNIAELLINSGAKVDCRDSNNKTTVLHLASKNAEEEWFATVQVLVKKVLDVDARDEFDQTALHYASDHGNVETVKCLLEAGADINASRSGSTPLLMAASSEHREVVLHLLKSGATFDGCDDEGQAVWHLAAGYGWLEVVQFLATRITDLEMRINDGSTALHLASLFNEIEIVKCLVQLNVDINARNDEGYTPLIIACKYEDYDVVEYLFHANADCDSVATDGFSPLYYLISARAPNIKLIKLFLEKTMYLPAYYDIMLNNILLKVAILQDVEFCCQVIVNKYNNYYLTELYKLPLAGSLPAIERMRIERSSGVFRALERDVIFEIHRKGHCTMIKVHPIVLQTLYLRSWEYYNTNLLN